VESPAPLYRILAGVSRPIAERAFGLEALGVEDLPAGGFILCANHLSGYDPWALALPLYPRQLRFMAKADLFRPPFRSLLDGLGLFPVVRGPAGIEAVAVAASFAAGGDAVLVFPEGARRRKLTAGETPRTGAARAALVADVPLVPAAVVGTDGAGPWRVHYGRPVRLDDLGEETIRAAARIATARVWSAVTFLERTLELERAA